MEGLTARGGSAKAPRGRSRLALLLSLALGGALSCGGVDPPEAANAPPASAANEAEGASFVGSAACAPCHREQQQLWTGSPHDLAMQPATQDTVLGDFADARFAKFPVMTRFFKKGGRFFVNTEGADGHMADFEVKYTFGVYPLQQYLIAFPGGRLQCLTIAWDSEKGRWFDLYPGERILPGDSLHWTGRSQRWNTMCAECHSTDLRQRYDLATDSYETTWADIDVGCEACHGPGSAHVAWAEAAKAAGVPATGDPELLVNFGKGDSRYQVEVCAPCHSRRHRVSGEDEVGTPYLDNFMPELLRAGLYHADGQVDAEVYVYGSFLQSKMYHRGVRCSDCHEPHGALLWVAGDALCVRCHNNPPDPRFPTLISKRYDTPEHHFHKPDSTGARCVACHMPPKNFMEVDPRHDHSLRVPRPDLSVALGTPNACNMCHADRSAEWSAEAVARWYGPNRRQEFRYGEVFAAARAGSPQAVPGLSAIAGDEQWPAIVRATAVELLEPYGPEAFPAIALATRADEPLVRAAAFAALDRMPHEQRLPIAARGLADPVRAVRVEAARVLAGVPSERFEPGQRRAFEAALAEYREAQQAGADTAAAHLNLGVLQDQQGDPAGAEGAYRTAIRLDPDFLPAYFNLATLYNRMHRNADAERALRDALQRFPEEGELHYSLGLLLAEEQRLQEAADELARAADLLPQRARVRYNLALALQHLGRNAEAEAALLRAREADPDDPEILNAVAVFYVQRADWERAQSYAQQLAALAPGAPGPIRMLQHIEAQLAAKGGARR
jgi:predicted CXXCH cytochrome family protein